MDNLRGKFGAFDEGGDDAFEVGAGSDDEPVVDATPPDVVGQDERRMQVRAYNYWASLLGERSFPSIEELEPEKLPDFAENSVLLDFTARIENPAIAFLGERLANECEDAARIKTLADVPGGSLLSRITDHYMQILANQAPIGFEAEFINDRGNTILYRGILLPFSTDDESIDFIYGVINWKEVADQLTTDELLLEIDQALEQGANEAAEPEPADDVLPEPVPQKRPIISSSAQFWDEGPGATAKPDATLGDDNGFPSPRFASLEPGPEPDNPNSAAPAATETVEQDSSSEHTSLHACLAEARELARAAKTSEDRSRAALYAAISRAYDVSLAADEEPEAFAAIVEEHGLSVQQRAPMTPVVKLVFGADYDKTRLTEYASVLGHARREQVARGALVNYLASNEGGVKGIVQHERRLRRQSGGIAGQRDVRERSHAKWRKLPAHPIATLPVEGSEFSVLVVRRLPGGGFAYLGEAAEDLALLKRAVTQVCQTR